MTNDEAIYTLKNTAFLGWDKQKEKVTETVRMAVEALKRETSGDAIDRQAVIDTLCDWICGVGERCVKTHCQCIRRIEAIPPAQPETHDKRTETHACDCVSIQAAIGAICNACGKIDCDQMDTCGKIDIQPINSSEIPNSSDTISRQAAIDALGGNEPVGDPSKMDDDDVVKMWERIRIINIINKLPSVQPERKTGQWILADTYDGRKRYRCSECLSFALKTDDGQENLSDYCPVCGARMEGGDDGTD